MYVCAYIEMAISQNDSARFRRTNNKKGMHTLFRYWKPTHIYPI